MRLIALILMLLLILMVYSLGWNEGVEHERNAPENYYDSISNQYLQDSCYDSTFKHIGQDDYKKQIGG